MTAQIDPTQKQLHTIHQALLDGTLHQVRSLLSDISSADIAHLMQSSPHREREILWQLTHPELKNELLTHLNEEVRAEFLSKMDTPELVALAQQLDTDDSADLLQELPDSVVSQVLRSMDEQDRERVEAVLSFDENTAGGLMNTDTVTVRPHITLDVVLRYIRRHEQLPDTTDQIFVVNSKGVYLGTLPLTVLLVSDPSLTVTKVMRTNEEPILATASSHEVAAQFERHDLVSNAVVNEQGMLLGRITIDDVLDVIREQADHTLLGRVGLDEFDDTFTPVIKTSRRRAIWLGINLFTAFLASSVIGLFDAIIEQVVALAILMPIVANMGGIAGTQTLTLIIRGMAVGQIGWANLKWFIKRELGSGIVNGIGWAIVVGLIASHWFNDPMIGYLIGVAMLVNLLVAAISGAVIPFALKRFNVDPALAGGVILTTITDIMGFMTFLGLATIFY